MSLSVCLLTRNEENNLPRVLGSVAGLADEILVADTGSSDRTIQVASGLGAKICPVAWQDDFAAARDFAIGQASRDWILWLNPDEELLPPSVPGVRQCLTRQDAFGYYLRVQDLPKADQPDSFTETAQLRLFRRHEAIRSVGRLQPSFVPSLEELAQREGKQVFPADILIRRHAYLSQPTEPKLRWALRLLELELRDRPGQLPYLIEYGRTLLMLNDAKGHTILAEAVEQILPVRDAPAAPLPEVQRLLEYLLTVSPRHSQSRLSHKEAEELALRWFPSSPPLIRRLAEQSFRAGNYRTAAELLERLAHMGRTGEYDKTENFEPGILGEAVLMNLGVCYLQLGELDRAESCFLRLLHSHKLGDQAARNLVMVQTQRAKMAQEDKQAGLEKWKQ